MKYAPLFVLAILQVVLTLVLRYKRHYPISRMFTYFTLTLFAWTLTNIILDYTTISIFPAHNSELTLFFLNITNIAGFFLGTLLLILLYRSVLALLKLPSDRLTQVVTMVGVIVAMLSSLPILSGSYEIGANGTLAYSYGNATFLITAYFILVGAATFKQMIKPLRSSLSRKLRAQAKTILLGLFASAAWGVVFIILLPTYFNGGDHLLFVGYFAPYIFTTFIFYSILKQGFLNFQFIIARFIGYTLALGAVVLGFIALTQTLIHFLSDKTITVPQAVAFALLNIITALTFGPAKRFFDRLTNKLFYHDAYEVQGFFDHLNRTLVSSFDLEKLLVRVSSVIMTNLKAEYCLMGLTGKEEKLQRLFGIGGRSISPEDLKAIRQLALKHSQNIVTDFLMEDESNMQLRSLLLRNSIAVFIPLHLDVNNSNQNAGWVAVGPKKSGNPYTQQDIRVLETVANELILAIQNALHFEEVQKFNATLQDKIDNATHKLRESNKKLKAMDETKDDFIGMASHQLRTPLTSVKGYLSLVLEGDAGKITSQQRKLLTQAFISSQRMVFLIADLLNVSRLKTGKFVIETTPVNLAEMVSDEVAQLRETAQARELTIEYHPPQHFPAFNLDETKTRQVVMNFLDNAIYYTPSKGHITVTLTDNPKSIELRVTDNGIGVPKAEQHHLFTKFYRAKNAQKARPDGTGLGLFMAKKVIVAQGGALIFESKEGEGSTFGFTFPKTAELVSVE